jgi:flagellar biosynthesis GTPase FlhF
VLSALSRAYYILAKTSKDVETMKLALGFIQRAIFSNPGDKTLYYNLALIEQQIAQILNDQSLENRSVEQLKAGLNRLDLSEKLFKFLSLEPIEKKMVYDVKRAAERALYCKGVKKVSEKKIHETEVLLRQREERLEEIKEKMRKDELKRNAEQELKDQIEQEKNEEIERKRKDLNRIVQEENEKNRKRSDEEEEGKRRKKKKVVDDNREGREKSQEVKDVGYLSDESFGNRAAVQNNRVISDSD